MKAFLIEHDVVSTYPQHFSQPSPLLDSNPTLLESIETDLGIRAPTAPSTQTPAPPTVLALPAPQASPLASPARSLHPDDDTAAPTALAAATTALAEPTEPSEPAANAAVGIAETGDFLSFERRERSNVRHVPAAGGHGATAEAQQSKARSLMISHVRQHGAMHISSKVTGEKQLDEPFLPQRELPSGAVACLATLNLCVTGDLMTMKR